MPPIPGNVVAEQIRFVENGAGTYTATVDLPAYAQLLDIQVYAVALWAAATSATLIVGDSVDDDRFYTGVNLKATDLLAGETVSFARPGGKGGVSVPADGTAGNQVLATLSNAARTLRASVTSVGAGATGETIVTFFYALPYRRQVTQ